MVYVISQDSKPLMPCSNPIARLLLKQGKAKVKRREPFTIKCGILITGCSSGYKIKPASVNQTGYVTQNPMSSAEYSLFLNKETTVFTNALVTRMNSIKNITKENKKEELAMIKTNLSDMEAAANEVRVTMPSVGRDEDKEAMDTAMEAAIEHMKSYKNALKKNKNTSEYVQVFENDFNEITGLAQMYYN